MKTTIRRRAGSCLALLAIFLFATSSRASAGNVSITTGYVDLGPIRGPFLMGGDRGFTFQSQLSESNSLIFALNCNGDPLSCRPGTTLDLGIHASGGDISGTATLDAAIYSGFGGANSVNNMAIDFAGSLVLPALSASATVTAPVTFTGTFTHAMSFTDPPVNESLTGSGTATVYLQADQNFPGSWRVTRLVYSLNQSLPAGWISADVGAVGQPGDASFSNGTFSLAGAGADIWDTADGFRFAFQPLAADGEIIARVDTLSNTNAFAKAGVMVRQSADTSSANVLLDVKPDGGIEFTTRNATGAATTFVAGATQSMAAWVKLTRTATTVTGSISMDGSVWTVVGSAELPTMPMIAGLVVTSHDNSVLAEAMISQVSISASTLPSPWSAVDVGDVGAAGSATSANFSFTVQGSGVDIWGTADAFAFVFQSVDGNAQIDTRVTGLDATDTFAKAGIMFRGSNDPSSAHVILDVRPDGSVEFMTRSVDGGDTTFIAGQQTSLPAWLRLVRTASLITGYISSNGTDWTTVGSTTATLPSRVFTGLAVTSHRAGTLATAMFGFANVVTGSGSFQSHDIGDVGVAGGQVFANGTYTMAGAGADIWGTSDSFHFADMPLFQSVFVARVVSVENTDPFAKAGIMIRESLAADAAHVILDLRPNGDVEFMMRSSTGAEAQFLAGATATAPVFFKLTIENPTTVTGWRSTDGNSWIFVGTAVVPVGSWSSARVGLVVTSHDTSRLNTSVFDRTP